MYEGAPDFPDRGRFWKLIEDQTDPLAWFEAVPLLAMLLIASCDTDDVDTLAGQRPSCR